jgi:FAD/FMN-containing dehydrogenase
VSPRDAQELSGLLAEKMSRAERVSSIDLRQMNRVLELTPEDMTVTVEAGIALGVLQAELAKHGQWLPIDPPNGAAISIQEVLSRNLSGPRRYGYGTIREHLIGMKMILADGRIIKSGGKVVKNVAGYDLARLFIGARDSLGVIVEATFKLRPLPETETFVSAKVPLERVAATLRGVLSSPVTPVVIDAHRLEKSAPAEGRHSSPGPGANVSVVLGFAGTREEVDWQLGEARGLGFETSATLDYEPAFWNEAGAVKWASFLPSRLTEAIGDLGPRPFVARAGNGVIYFRGEPLRNVEQKSQGDLMRRFKDAYDPKSILPEFSV